MSITQRNLSIHNFKQVENLEIVGMNSQSMRDSGENFNKMTTQTLLVKIN